MTFWIFQLKLKVCPFTSPPVSQHCLTVAKCVLMTATFSGVYFKESASTMSSAAPKSHHCAPSVCTNWCPEGAFNGPGGTSCSVLPLTCFSALLETAEQLQVAPMGPWWACPQKQGVWKLFASQQLVWMFWEYVMCVFWEYVTTGTVLCLLCWCFPPSLHRPS